MPNHARNLTILLVINAVVGALPLLDGFDLRAIISLVIRVLLLVGFLKGSEGVRTLLLIGAAVSVIFGGAGLLVSIPLLGAAGGAGMIAVLVSGFSIAVGLYMLFALREPAVTEWMLNRSLGGALDDE